ncbi:MAG: EscU/YscU/HrcU family type III secretion system export apparatus switch protein, partial [Pseudomonadota bacterium]|nr:EscU/YscU/HrcU family type III secretion system export apparatus switch protein [Pseudomonadota bacterium]
MAEENQDGQEKTEEPTQQRLKKAADDGQLLTSKEVMVFTTLAAGLLLYMGLSPFLSIGLNTWAQLFVIDSIDNLHTLSVAKVRHGFWLVVLATLIFGIPLVIVTILTQLAVGGLNFSNKAYNFKPSRINPISGMKRIFSMKGLVELGKAVLKVVLLFSIGAVVILQQLPSMIQLSS